LKVAPGKKPGLLRGTRVVGRPDDASGRVLRLAKKLYHRFCADDTWDSKNLELVSG